jgi:NAD(P)-dependent dehydrogenase (short-subunit alcohol dehydrogenase family)
MAPPYGFESTGAEIAKDLAANIAGKTILITGPSPGSIGAFFLADAVPAKPGLLILAGRSLAKLQKTVDELRAIDASVQTKLLQLELGSFASCRKAAAEVNGWADVPHIDLLVGSAGIMAVPFAKTEDGFESQFATNHLGHFLFINLVMGKVLAAKEPRVVVVSSDGHRVNPIRWMDYNFGVGRHRKKRGRDG